MSTAESSRHYQKIAAAIEYFVDHQQQQPGLAELSAHVGMSEFHLQRIFSDWVGVSPKQFLKFITKEQAKARLREGPVLQAALDSGLSGAGRLHDLMISCEGMTPGEFKNQGAGITIQFGVHPSPFGFCLLAQTAKGVCNLVFFDDPEQQHAHIEFLREQWPNANLVADAEATSETIGKIFPEQANLQQPNSRQKGTPGKMSLNVLLKGSPFQLKVWEALLSIPQGELVSYQQVADRINAPSSVRAVASAVAKNNIGYLIPCHRVIRSSGDFSQYRWGANRKRVMIGWEASQTQV